MTIVKSVERPTPYKMIHRKKGDVYASFLALVLDPYVDSFGKKHPHKVLINRRWDGLIGFPGGKVDYHQKDDGILWPETLEAACVREVKEEIGLHLVPWDVNYVCTHEFPREGYPDNFVSSSLFIIHTDIKLAKDILFCLDITEVSGIEYMTFEDVLKNDEILCDSVVEEIAALKTFLKV